MSRPGGVLGLPMSDSQREHPVPTFAADAPVCGNCKLWQPHSVDERGWVGPCRILPERGLFPPSAPRCNKFTARGQTAAELPADSSHRARTVRSVAPVVKRRVPGEGGTTSAAPSTSASSFTTFRAPTPDVELGDLFDMTRDELMNLFREAAGDSVEPPPLAQKWSGGTIQIVPGNKDLQAKELAIDALFHKVVMARDRLRTLEQKINGHPKLSDAEKVEMQSYITRVYGSFTSFNMLFRDKADFFVGQKSDE